MPPMIRRRALRLDDKAGDTRLPAIVDVQYYLGSFSANQRVVIASRQNVERSTPDFRSLYNGLARF